MGSERSLGDGLCLHEGVRRRRRFAGAVALVLALLGLASIPASALADTPPTLTIDPPSALTANSAHLSGSVNPEGGPSAAEWQFQYSKAPDSEGWNPIGQGVFAESEAEATTPLPVAAQLTGLGPGVEYFVRLTAQNAGGEATPAEAAFTTPALAPTISSTFASRFGETEATLGARIIPGGAATTYHFEYVDQSRHAATGFAEATSTAILGAGSDDTAHLVDVNLTGLIPTVTYFYRVIASNSVAPAGVVGPVRSFITTTTGGTTPSPGSCPNEAFRTGASPELPECRAYEQVSPVQKNGFSAYPVAVGVPPAQASPDGSRLAFTNVQAFPGAEGNTALFAGHLAVRGAIGWGVSELTPPEHQVIGQATPYLIGYDFSEDLSQTLVTVPANKLTPESTAGVYNLYLRGADGTYSWVNSAQPATLPSELCPPLPVQQCYNFADATGYAGASRDLSHVLFESNAQLTPEAPESSVASIVAGVESLYEKTGAEVRLVGILPDNSPAERSTAGAGSSIHYQSFIRNVDNRVENAISADGSRVVFQAPSDEGEPAEAGQAGLTEVYDRIGGTETIELSQPNAGATPANAAAEPAQYWAASVDGSRVFFTSTAELTGDADTGPANESADLYEYDFGRPAADRLRDLSATSAPSGAGVLGVLGASDDGSTVYFTAEAKLDGEEGVAGKPNLYVVRGDGPPRFIATLAPRVIDEDEKATEEQGLEPAELVPGDSRDWRTKPFALTSYVTPDGEHLAFMSIESLTGYDNLDQRTGEPDSEVYAYSFASDSLACASCRPDREPPLGPALLGGVYPLGGKNLSDGTPFHRPRSLSDDGDRLFFVSSDPLDSSPQTADTQSSYLKVYEYQAPGSGSCVASTGCTRRLSAPDNPSDDTFLDASSSGDDVFIATASRLAPGDDDALSDIYDVRVDGKSTLQPESSGCESGCRSLPGSETTPAPLSSFSATSGNLQEGRSPAHHKKHRRHRHRRRHHHYGRHQSRPNHGHQAHKGRSK